MTVAELTEWLKTQDQAATVYVVSHKRSMLRVLFGWDEPDTVQTVVFDPSRHAEYTDYSHLSKDGQPATELLLGVFLGGIIKVYLQENNNAKIQRKSGSQSG